MKISHNTSFLIMIALALELLLGAETAAMSTALLAAVGGPLVQAGVALAAHHFVAVVFLGQDLEGGFDNTATETQHQVEGRLLLDIVVAQSAEIRENK